MGMDFIMYMPRPSLRPGKSAATWEEWRRRTQSRHEVSALWERPHQVKNPGREERRDRGAGEEHLSRWADEGAGGAPSARPKLGLRETEEETGNRFILSTIRQKVFACEDDRSGRGSVCWGRLDPDLRESKCSSSGPRTASRTAGNRRRGASGKPACAQSESDWRAWRRGARELERRGRTRHRGGGAEETRGL